MPKLTELAKSLIDGKNFACVATLMPDGSPQVAPLWIERDGDTVVINTTITRQRYKNLQRDPRIGVTVFDMANPYVNVVIWGKVVEMTQSGAEEHIDKLSMKYSGKKYPYHEPHSPRVIVRIEPSRISS